MNKRCLNANCLKIYIAIKFGVTFQKTVRDLNGRSGRPVNLIIPGASLEEDERLKPGAKYKFRLCGTVNGKDISCTDAILETKDTPKYGKFEVSFGLYHWLYNILAQYLKSRKYFLY